MKQANILFFFPDQWRADWLGSNTELKLRTPNIDKLQQTGMTFDKCWTPSPLCAPARACLASGKSYKNCGVINNNQDYPLEQPTYMQKLRDAGYRVAGVGKFDLHKSLKKPLDWHLDGSRSLKEWGFTEGIDNEGKIDGSSSYRDNGFAPKGPYLNHLHKIGIAKNYCKEHDNNRTNKGAYVTCVDDDSYCDNWLSENGLKFLRNFPKDQPWYLHINFTGPHDPMDVTQSMHDAWKGVEFPMPVNNSQTDFSYEDHQRNRQHYAAMIENIDRQIGRVIDAVKARGELDNTIIVFCSDHGEMLGDLNKWGKSVPNEASVRIPLVISGPGIPQGVKSNALVSLEDLAPSFIQFAGADKLEDADARNIVPLLEGQTTQGRDFLISSLDGWKTVYDGQYKLIIAKDGTSELFDMSEAFFEIKDISADNQDIKYDLEKVSMI